MYQQMRRFRYHVDDAGSSPRRLRFTPCWHDGQAWTDGVRPSGQSIVRMFVQLPQVRPPMHFHSPFRWV